MTDYEPVSFEELALGDKVRVSVCGAVLMRMNTDSIISVQPEGQTEGGKCWLFEAQDGVFERAKPELPTTPGSVIVADVVWLDEAANLKRSECDIRLIRVPRAGMPRAFGWVVAAEHLYEASLDGRTFFEDRDLLRWTLLRDGLGLT